MKGSITIFSCILLATIILLNCVLVDTAKVLSVKSDMKKRSELALSSVLAGFDSILRDQYGLFALDGTKNVKEEFLTYFNVRDTSYGGSAFSVKQSDNYPAIDILNYDTNKVTVELIDKLTDTEVLRKQIIDEMKIRTPVNFGKSIIDKIKILSDSGNMSEAFKKQAEVTALMNEVTYNVETLKTYVEGKYIGDPSCVNGYDKHNRFISYMSLIRSGYDLIKASNAENKETKKAIDDMKDAVLKMKTQAMMYLEFNVNAIDQLNTISDVQTKTFKKIKEIEKWIVSYETDDELDVYYKQIIIQKKNELKSKVNVMGNTHLKDPLNKNADILSKIVKACDNLVKLLDMPKDLVILESELKSYLLNLDNKGIITNLEVHTCFEDYDKSYKGFDNRKKAEQDLKAFLKEHKTVNIPNKLHKTLPSIVRNIDSSSFENEILQKFDSSIMLNTVSIVMSIMSLTEEFKDFCEDPGEYIKEGVLIDDYIMSYFGNTVEGIESRSGFFKSEVEYVIAGTSSEGTNRLICQTMIFAIRFYMNVIHIMCDIDKTDLATKIGNAIAGSISCGLGGPLYALLVVAGWAICESVLDANELLKGKDIPLLKRKSDWKFSIEGLTQKVAGEDINSDSFFNMSYSDYLRILLAFTGKETKLLRICDLIEINMTNFLNRRYTLSSLFTKARVNVTFHAEMFSSSLMFVPETKKENDMFVLTEVYNAGY